MMSRVRPEEYERNIIFMPSEARPDFKIYIYKIRTLKFIVHCILGPTNLVVKGTGVVSFTDLPPPPITSGTLPENNGPPPLTLEPSAECTIFPSAFPPDGKVFNLSIKNY